MINTLFILSVLLVLTGCSSQERMREQTFSKTSTNQLKEKAGIYSDEEFSKGVVPLHEFVKLSGTIIKSDSKKSELEKGDRFVLETADGQYQVFNEQSQGLQLHERVTIYGEYYGFIKATLIERNGMDEFSKAAIKKE